MTYKELVQATVADLGTASASKVPSIARAKARDYLSSAVRFVAEAYVELQQERKWKWMRRHAAFDIKGGQDRYPVAELVEYGAELELRFAYWLPDPKDGKWYLEGDDLPRPADLSHISDLEWRRLTMERPEVDTGRPRDFAIDSETRDV